VATDPSGDRTPQERSWEEHNLSQLRHFRSLSLREKMEAVQGMADVLQRFEEMRARGEFASARAAAGGSQAAPSVHEPPPPYEADK
jgi:hypothetical protein